MICSLVNLKKEEKRKKRKIIFDGVIVSVFEFLEIFCNFVIYFEVYLCIVWNVPWP